jgi:hypothetical protein
MTQHGTYNETFWVAIAAAAPVIALASTVQITDIQKLFVFSKQEAERFPWRRYISLPALLSTGNIILQILGMYSALTSLARRSNILNLSLIIILEIVGMAIVVAVAFIAVLGHMKVNAFRHVLAREYGKTGNKPNGGDDALSGTSDRSYGQARRR